MGHAIEFFQADAYARYFRKKLGAENVFLNVGVDEHGLKVFTTANEMGLSTQNYLDQLVPHWLDFCEKFSISFDNFYRTSSRNHHSLAQAIWKSCDEAGDIYFDKYSGLYCVGCEAFILERNLIDGRCPQHGTEPVKHDESNYFFKLSRYATQILAYVQDNPEFLKPASKLDELKNLLNDLKDINISRLKSNLPWGIEVPGDASQMMYVWFDALTNYISAVGYGIDEEKFNSFWPGVQLCGPDNLRFQAAIWQGMLASIDLPFTKHLLVHGTILGPDGQKMSKTRGNVISPLDQFEKFGSDACRFYMLYGLSTYVNCSYKEEELIDLYNAKLANNYGNLLNRLIHLAIKNDVDLSSPIQVDERFRHNVDSKKEFIESQYITFELQKAVNGIDDLISDGNSYFHKMEPWAKDKSDSKQILKNIGYLVRIASELYMPIIPQKAIQAVSAMDKKEKEILFPKL